MKIRATKTMEAMPLRKMSFSMTNSLIFLGDIEAYFTGTKSIFLTISWPSLEIDEIDEILDDALGLPVGIEKQGPGDRIGVGFDVVEGRLDEGGLGVLGHGDDFLLGADVAHAVVADGVFVAGDLVGDGLGGGHHQGRRREFLGPLDDAPAEDVLLEKDVGAGVEFPGEDDDGLVGAPRRLPVGDVAQEDLPELVAVRFLTGFLGWTTTAMPSRATISYGLDAFGLGLVDLLRPR